MTLTDKTKVMVYYIDHRELASLAQSPEFLRKITDPTHPLIADRYLQIWKRQKRNSLQALVSGLLLSHVLGVTRDEQLVVGEHGKPELSYAANRQPETGRTGSSCNPESGTDGISHSFSISHARDYTILAVMESEDGSLSMKKATGGHLSALNCQKMDGNNTELFPRPQFPLFGADIEERIPAGDERKRKYHASIVQKYFPVNSRQRYELAPEGSKNDVFIVEWTALEAVLKAHGTGFVLPREEIEAVAARYLVRHAELGDHVIAVAVENDFSKELPNGFSLELQEVKTI